MRNVILSLVLVVALAIATVGGTFATWSDSETSEENYIETGSLDLLVNGADDLPWGTGVPTKVELTCMIPCKMYGPFEVELWNAGQDCMPPASAYIEIKEVDCWNVDPKEGSGYPDPVTGDLKPEPELVAEYGGKVDCKTVPGIGVLGDDCTLGEYIEMVIVDAGTGVVLVDNVPIQDMVDQEIYLFELIPCTARTIHLFFHLRQPSEEDFGHNFIPNEGEEGYDALYHAKFNDWPSWALMKDVINFNMEFDLWLVDP